MRELEGSWKSVITITRQAPNDVGYREIYVSLDGERPETLLMHGEVLTREVSPGAHRLKAHNTLFVKTIDFTIEPKGRFSLAAAQRFLGGFDIMAPRL